MKARDLPAQRPRSLGLDAAARLLRNREALLGALVVLLFTLTAIFGPRIAPYDPYQLHSNQDNLPAAWATTSPIGKAGDPAFLLGTDSMGRDILSLAIYGARSAMFLALVTAPVVVLIGALVGLLAGYAGGQLDNLIMRAADVFYALPSIMFYIIIVLILRRQPAGYWLNGMFTWIVALGAIGWVGVARLMRGSVMSLKQRDFVEAARCVGARHRRIIFRHILPNSLSPLLVWITFAVPQMIIAEAILGYLGITLLDINREAAFSTSWGEMFMAGRQAIHSQPMLTIVPALCVAIVSIGFTLLGDGLRDAFDPTATDDW